MRIPRGSAVQLAILATGALTARAAFASAGPGEDPLMPLLAALVLVLVAARLGGALFAWLKLPAVLGELAAGVLLANLPVPALALFHGPGTQAVLDVLAQIGVLFLLFQVGLASDLGPMLAVGRSALLVALLGVAAPMALGWGVSALFHPGQDPLTHGFVGATLAATSVGVTARVLADLGRVNSAEGRIILGAAVIDDVLGLVVLAVVVGVIHAAAAGQPFSPAGVAIIVVKAAAFLAGALLAGGWVARHAFAFAARLKGDGLLLSVALAFCFALAWLAGLAGLAPIVGAFAAGLALEKAHYRELLGREQHARGIEDLLAPLAQFLVPVFFVLMGMKVDARAFARPEVLGFAALLTLAAVIGKQACALGVLEKGADRFAVGLGMIPRGEVGLIFAGIGAGLRLRGAPVIDAGVFSAVVVMVALTTLVTPPLLAWRLRKSASAGRAA